MRIINLTGSLVRLPPFDHSFLGKCALARMSSAAVVVVAAVHWQ